MTDVNVNFPPTASPNRSVTAGDVESMVTQVKADVEGQVSVVSAQLADTARKTDIVDMATKGYVTEQIVNVNTGGTVDISSKADVTYVNQEVDKNKLLTFNSLTELQTTHPNGLNKPVWIASEKMWYSWVPDVRLSYLAENATSKSTSAYWKGSSTLIKQDIKLTEIGSVGLPRQWNIWEVVADKLNTLVASGEFTNLINNVTHYNKHTLTTPIVLKAGKTYILIIKYDADASYYLTGEDNGVNDAYVDCVTGVYNRIDTPIVGLAVSTAQASQFVYKHYLKYEV